MRMVAAMEELDQAYSLAKSEALKAFGSDEIYLEKYLEHPKHIEVQIIGDTHGNIVHLHERDCSVQRRHQKLVEVAPAFSLPQDLRSRICDAAVKLMKNVDYVSAGTVEFWRHPIITSILLMDKSAYPGRAYRYRRNHRYRHRTDPDQGC